jgi:hypothetical protein
VQGQAARLLFWLLQAATSFGLGGTASAAGSDRWWSDVLQQSRNADAALNCFVQVCRILSIALLLWAVTVSNSVSSSCHGCLAASCTQVAAALPIPAGNQQVLHHIEKCLFLYLCFGVCRCHLMAAQAGCLTWPAPWSMVFAPWSMAFGSLANRCHLRSCCCSCPVNDGPSKTSPALHSKNVS